MNRVYRALLIVLAFENGRNAPLLAVVCLLGK